MDRTTETAKAVVESELGIEVTSVWLAEEKEFLGVKLAIWRARTQGGKEWWVILHPVPGVYPIEEWSDVDRLFSYHLGQAFRLWDEQELIHVVGSFFIGTYPAESPCR